MKSIYFCLFALTALSTAMAQPVLTRSDLQQGVPIQFSFAAPANPGNAGENVTWDFSNLQITGGGTFESIDPATAPHKASYPTCNVVHNVANSFYNYYKVTDNKMEWIGYRIGPNSNNLDLTPDPLTLLKFPFKYQEKFSDTIKSVDGSFNSVYILEYDGYGTLKTPYGTYNNAVRIKRATPDNSDVVYEWYIAAPSYFSYAILQITSGSTRVYKYHSTSIDDTEYSLLAKVYPSPSSGKIHVEIPWPKATLKIWDLTGKILRTQDVIDKEVVELELPDGLYHYSLQNYSSLSEFRGKLVIAK